MTASAPAVEERRARPLRGILQRNGWTLGLLGFLVVLLVFTKVIQPSYGVSGIQGLAIAVLPLALAAAAQAVVVIAGGIDLSIGSMMALTSVIAAARMDDQSAEVGVTVVVLVVVIGLVLGAVNGALVVVTRVPDIVVTLAMSFVWAGAALLVLRTPGGGSVEWLRDLVLGPFGNEWIPRAAIVLAVVVAVIWIPLQRSRLGLSFYAIGSNQLAAFRSGVSVGWTKFLAYVVAGLFSALAGIMLLASTGIGTPVPGPYTLLSVAAVVLGGVSLFGGRATIVAPVMGAILLTALVNGLTRVGLSEFYQPLTVGVVVVLAAFLTRFNR